MAKITMTLNGLSHYDDARVATTAAIALSTDRDEATVLLAVGTDAKTILSYKLSISDFSMKKKMYEPTEIIADLSITQHQQDYKEIGRKQLEELFKHIKVSLVEGNFSFGDDFYVHEVIPHFKSASMHVTLKIYSIDKLLTINKTSRTFVNMKLGEDILKAEAPKYVAPWSINRQIPVLEKNIKKTNEQIAKLDLEIQLRNGVPELTDEEKKEIEDKRKTDPEAAKKLEEQYAKRTRALTDDEVKERANKRTQLLTDVSQLETDKNQKDKEQTRLTCNISNMRFLSYKKVGETDSREHIFPFLVQYNESFYDMLARTTNRWGEFLYYENKALNIGYDAKATATPINRKLTQDISYCDLNAKYLTLSTDGKYDYEADNSSLTGKPLMKSPVIVKGQMGDFGGKGDKWAMKQFATFFKNDKDLPTCITNMLIDNLYSLAMAESSVAKLNSDFNKKYFPDNNKPGRDEQYGQWNFANKKKNEADKFKDGYQQFSELGTSFNGDKYKGILKKEQTVGKDAICIDFGTNNPQLKLGSIISYSDENFIVVEIVAGYDDKRNVVFQVTGTAEDTAADAKKDDKEMKIFYPAVIPAGHVRYANPQVATITDPDDPTSKNRARVMFSWQKVEYKDDKDKSKGATDKTIQQSTPWLNFASNQNGYPVMGYHYTGDQVMVGFEEGNVERPYILGGLADDFLFADSVLASPGMHQLTLTDGLGDGLIAALAGILSPTFKTFMGFCPKALPKLDFKYNKYLEGGFELTDYYGTYKISGSTDGRNVSIASNWGDVKINAFTGINISAPNGDIKISGKNVTIEAGNNLNLVSGKNVKYKLYKSKDTPGGALAQYMVDATAAVAKKLAQVTLGGIIDFSFIRATVEIVFRPVEGSLTVKSNRFLKLEAGNNGCKFPASAFNKEEKLKVLNAMNKKTINESIGLGPGMVSVFEKIPSVVESLFGNYYTNYENCLPKKQLFERAVSQLTFYSNNPTAEPCKTYEQLKDDLWSQKENTDWTEEKLAFTDDVAVDGEKEKIVPIEYFQKHCPEAIATNSQKRNAFRDDVRNERLKLRKQCLDTLNDLRKTIYETTHVEVNRKQVTRMFGHVNPSGMPKDYKEKLVSALSKDKCPKVRCYAGNDKDKELNEHLTENPVGDVRTIFGKDIKYFKRVAAMNLLKAFGFDDSARRKVAINGGYPQLPPVPKTDDPNNTEPGSVMNSWTWVDYIESINAIPPIGKDKSTFGAALKDATVGTIKDKYFNGANSDWNVFKSFQEKKTWGEGKKGQILFAADNTTYALKNKQFDSIEVLQPTVKGLEPKSENDAIDGFVKQMRNCLGRF